MTITIRPATAADQPAITALVRGAHLNPFRIGWRNFLVAEDAGRVVGVGQVRPHGDGSRELASLAVKPDHQGAGIGAQLTWALLAREAPPTYLFCQEQMAAFYTRFGFHTVGRAELPPALALMHRLGNLLAAVSARLTNHPTRIIAMRRDG
jgi:N-acetylglutamate synthase-like GNAT family acetyltransferase